MQRSVSEAAQYRYALVLGLVLTLAVFVIVAPDGDGSRAVALALEIAALIVAIATSRARDEVRRRRVALVVAAGVVATVLVAAGLVPHAVSSLLAGLLAAAIPFALGGGLLRLISARGVTVQAVAGALAVYLVVGLLFGWLIGVVADASSAPYFAQGTSGTASQRMYFSFTVLTTTGFGDLSAATKVGRAIAVVEMLAGQLYLVTVISVLVGGLVSRRQR
jgi:Ion channel